MIPAHGVKAYYTEGGREREVIAWDDDGVPMVMGRTKLQKASANGDYVLHSHSTYVGIVPVQGDLHVKLTDVPDRHGDDRRPLTQTVPVLAWLIERSGVGQPLLLDEAGFVAPAGDVIEDGGGWNLVETLVHNDADQTIAPRGGDE